MARLHHRRETLPELAEIDQLSTKRKELDDQRVDLQTTVDDLTREQKKADQEVELVKARKLRDDERLNSGAITDPHALEAIQHELGALERRISTLEDAELEVMEQLETAQADLDNVTGELRSLDAKVDELAAARDAAFVDLDSDVATTTAQRATLVGGVPQDLLALYDKVRAQYGGLGAAALVARACQGCRLQLNDADLREIAALADDEVCRCPECSRILVRTAESGI